MSKTGKDTAPGKPATTTVLTRAERKALEDQIREAKEALMLDKATRPKRKLTQKQLDNLAKGRAANPNFRPKKSTKNLNARLEKQMKDGNASNGHVAVGYK